MNIAKKVSIIILIIIISGLSSIAADRYFFPFLVSTKWFSKYDFIKKSIQDVTVINRTEQVYVKEETSIDKIAGQVSTSVANIIIYENPDQKLNSGKKQAVQPNSANLKNSTGVVITNDGLILTYLNFSNYKDYKYKAILNSGKTYDAEITDFDPYSNLAFLKINESNLPVISFGNSDDSKPGEKLIAIGNSLESSGNVFASGLLSSLNPTYNLSGKTVSSSEKLEGVFRADFPSSENLIGGPIVDYSGQVIGITGSIMRDNKNEYFQIPSNKARSVVDKKLRKEIDQNAYLGIYYAPITAPYALANNLKTENGARITSPSGQQGLAIIAGSPAALAGLKIDDIITEISGEKITSAKSLSDLLYNYKKGDSIELTIMRENQEMKMIVAL